MTRPHWILASSVAVAVGVLGLALVELSPDVPSRRTGGPLACRTCARTSTSGPASVGEAVSMGPLSLRNEGEETAVLERVELLDVDPGLEIVGTLVVKPAGRHPLVGSGYGFPPRQPGGSTHPVRGFRLAPARSRRDFVQVMVGVRLTAKGRSGARRMAVDYRVDRTRYRAYFFHSIWLCTDRNDPERCANPDS